MNSLFDVMAEKEFSELFSYFTDVLLQDVCIMDSSAIVRWVSRSWTEKSGIPAEEAVGMSARDLEESGVFRPSVSLQVLQSQIGRAHV